MPVTERMDIPSRPVEKEPWSMKRLFPLAGVTTAMAKTFTSPFEVLFGFALLVTGICELIGKHPSWMWYLTIILILGVCVYIRHNQPIITGKPEKK